MKGLKRNNEITKKLLEGIDLCRDNEKTEAPLGSYIFNSYDYTRDKI